MWAVYLVLLVLAVVRAGKLQYCQELTPGGSTLRKDVATMVITMDGTCATCYQEIQKLVKLKTQMARLGHNADILVAMDHLPQDHEHELPSGVAVDLEQVWKKLGQLNGHIFVFDKCGKLAYQVITPWSKQMYPFTAMASLSALYDAPCGECNSTSQVIEELQDELLREKPNESRGNQSEETFGGMQVEENRLPLTITIPERHEHILNGKRVTYDAVELKTNDPNYHGHGAALNANSEPNTSLFTSNRTDVQKNETYIAEGKNGSTVSFQERNGDLGATEPTKHHDDYIELLKRYQPLMKWRSCANLVMSIKIQ